MGLRKELLRNHFEMGHMMVLGSLKRPSRAPLGIWEENGCKIDRERSNLGIIARSRSSIGNSRGKQSHAPLNTSLSISACIFEGDF